MIEPSVSLRKRMCPPPLLRVLLPSFATLNLIAFPVFTDDRGHAVFLNWLTEAVTGWRNSHMRIRAAIDGDEFDLCLQDIVALGTGTTSARPDDTRLSRFALTTLG